MSEPAASPYGPLADAHLHLFEGGFAGSDHLAGADELGAYAALRVAHQIDRGLVVGFEGEERFAGNNAYLLDSARTHDWIAPLAYVDPTTDADRVDAIINNGFDGVSIYPPAAPDRSYTDWLSAVLAAADARAAVVSLNVRPTGYRSVADALGDRTDLTVLLSHLGLPGPGGPDHDAGQASPLLDHPRVSVKISGLYAASEPSHAWPHSDADAIIDRLITRLGPDRLVWGSDFSPALGHVSFVQAVDVVQLAGLDRKDQTKIRHANLHAALDRVSR